MTDKSRMAKLIEALESVLGLAECKGEEEIADIAAEALMLCAS